MCVVSVLGHRALFQILPLPPALQPLTSLPLPVPCPSAHSFISPSVFRLVHFHCPPSCFASKRSRTLLLFCLTWVFDLFWMIWFPCQSLIRFVCLVSWFWPLPSLLCLEFIATLLLCHVCATHPETLHLFSSCAFEVLMLLNTKELIEKLLTFLLRSVVEVFWWCWFQKSSHQNSSKKHFFFTILDRESKQMLSLWLQ